MNFEYLKEGYIITFFPLDSLSSLVIKGKIVCKQRCCSRNDGLPIFCIERTDGRLGDGCEGRWKLRPEDLNIIENGDNYINLEICGIPNPNHPNIILKNGI